MKYGDVLNTVYKGDLSKVPCRLLCLDPGETTGWALFIDGHLNSWGQIETVDMQHQPAWEPLEELFMDLIPTCVVCENYRVYAHKLERHSNSEVVTLRLIGGIDYMCRMWTNMDLERRPIPIHYQMAAQHKGFVTDDRLRDWGFWRSGMKHSRDAIRVGLYFLVVTNRPGGSFNA